MVACSIFWTVIDFSHIENILQTYTFEEILQLNELTEEEVLYFLVEQEFVTLPNPKPL